MTNIESIVADALQKTNSQFSRYKFEQAITAGTVKVSIMNDTLELVLAPGIDLQTSFLKD